MAYTRVRRLLKGVWTHTAGPSTLLKASLNTGSAFLESLLCSRPWAGPCDRAD